GLIMLIGIVKKNAIMMTTMAALLGAMPIALGWGAGAESRKPLGLAVVGGLLVSQVLTLYFTPVDYIYLDKLRFRKARLTLAEASENGKPEHTELKNTAVT